jgi:hypothetical protein
MKKLFALACVMLASHSVTAATKPFAQTTPWSIRSAGVMWYVPNPTGTVNIRFTVNRTLTSRPTMASDSVTFLCDKTYIVKAGDTVNCRLTNFVRAEFQVTGDNLKNGAEGSYTIS